MVSHQTMSEAPKPYVLSFEERPGYLYARIQADTMTPEISVAYLGELANKCAELGMTRVVIDRHVPFIIDSVSLFFSMQEEIKLIKGLKIAILNAFPATNEALDFAILVSNNRGANLKLHQSLGEAEKWLLA